MQIEILEKIMSLPAQSIESLRDAGILMSQLENPDRRLLLWLRKEARKIESPEAYELIRDSYFMGAQNNFDDYMIACEWNREPKARFWLPRRKVLEGKHKIATRIQRFIDNPDALYLGFSMPPGTGKSTLIKFLLAYIAGKFPMSANMYVSYSDGTCYPYRCG